jgi:N-acetylmuramoyl-L-alanine amidase
MTLMKTSFAFLLVFINSLALAAPLPNTQRVVVIDPGHEPSKGGATSSCGEKEVVYNDRMVQDITKALKSYQVVLTRQPGKEVAAEPDLKQFLSPSGRASWVKAKSLLARPAIANSRNADLFISIHHDSVSEKHQIPHDGNCKGKTVSDDFRKNYKIGFNVFVNDEGKEPNRTKSIKLATLIGKSLIEIGRVPSDYHFYPVDDCKSCKPINKKYGVWHHDLAVLREAKMPAVLIEVGNIVDHKDEGIMVSEAFRAKFSSQIKKAVDEYFLN